jgi:hypothetical protein
MDHKDITTIADKAEEIAPATGVNRFRVRINWASSKSETYGFDSKAELEAFLWGVAEANAWGKARLAPPVTWQPET